MTLYRLLHACLSKIIRNCTISTQITNEFFFDRCSLAKQQCERDDVHIRQRIDDEALNPYVVGEILM